MFQAVGVSVVAEAASEEETEADEAVVGVVAEAEEVTLMVKAARKLKKQSKFKLQEQKKSFSRKFSCNWFHEKNKKY